MLWSRNVSRRQPGGALKLAFLVEDDLQLFLQRHPPEETIQGHAVGDAVFVAVNATVCERNEMLDACLRFLQGLSTKEAASSLGEHKAFDGLRWHRRRLAGDSGAPGL